ncbi:unnamed protein product [Ixodes pacificus]
MDDDDDEPEPDFLLVATAAATGLSFSPVSCSLSASDFSSASDPASDSERRCDFGESVSERAATIERENRHCVGRAMSISSPKLAGKLNLVYGSRDANFPANFGENTELVCIGHVMPISPLNLMRILI